MQPKLDWIWFNSVPYFQRRHGSNCKTDMNGLVRVWPNTSGSKQVCRNHQAWFLAGCNQPTTSFLLSDSVAFFYRCPRPDCAKPAQIQFSSGDRQFLAKQTWYGNKLVCKNHPACFWNLSWSGSDLVCLVVDHKPGHTMTIMQRISFNKKSVYLSSRKHQIISLEHMHGKSHGIKWHSWLTAPMK